jgi:putative acyl-CoA dehydrogenase
VPGRAAGLSKEPGVLDALFAELGDGHGDRRLAAYRQPEGAFADTGDISTGRGN